MQVAVMKYTKPSTNPIGKAGPAERTSANAARLTPNAVNPTGISRRLSIRGEPRPHGERTEEGAAAPR